MYINLPKTGQKFVVAQKTKISISGDADFSDMKKTETQFKRRRVGRYDTDMKGGWDVTK